MKRSFGGKTRGMKSNRGVQALSQSGSWVKTLLGVIHFLPSFWEITPVTPTHGWPHMQPGTSFEPFTPCVAISPGAK